MPLNLSSSENQLKSLRQLLGAFINIATVEPITESELETLRHDVLYNKSKDGHYPILVVYNTSDMFDESTIEMESVSTHQLSQLKRRKPAIAMAIKFEDVSPYSFGNIALNDPTDKEINEYDAQDLINILNSPAALNELANVNHDKIVSESLIYGSSYFSLDLNLNELPITSQFISNDQTGDLLALILVIVENKFTIKI